MSPDILGVSAGAGLGACAAILWGLSIVYIQLYAFCGGLMVVAERLVDYASGDPPRSDLNQCW